MGKSTRLRLSDIRRVYRITCEIAELGHDPELWRSHMAGELLKFLDLQMATTYVVPIKMDAKKGGFFKIAVCGLDESSQRKWAEYGQRGDVSSDPCTPAIMSRLPNAFSTCRRMLVDDRTWYRSNHYNDLRSMLHCDDMVLSMMPIPEIGVLHGIHGDRSVGQQPIGRRETICLILIHRELSRMWKRFFSAREQIQKQLSPRLVELLDHLCGPDSEKEIAQSMGLSPHTVHNHVRRLYAKFNVSSRAELMTVGGGRHLGGVPRLGIAVL